MCSTQIEAYILTTVFVESKLDIFLLKIISYYHLPQMVPFLVADHKFKIGGGGRGWVLSRVISLLLSTVHVCTYQSVFYITMLHCRVKEIVGYDPEEFFANHERFFDCLHPAEYSDMMAKAEHCK